VILGAPPAAYRVTYRVDAGNPVGRVVRTEILEVARPWQSRLTTKQGPPPGRAVTDVRFGDFGKLDLRPTGQTETVLVLQPDLAAFDLRLDVDLAALVTVHGVEIRERRKVAGRLCQVYRTTSPPQGQTIGKLPSASGDEVDSCVDSRGIILEQLQRFKGRLLIRRRAVRVDLRPRFAPHELDVTAASTVPTSLGGGAIAQLDPASAATVPGATFFLDHPPDGFAFQGHYAVTPSQPPNSGGLPERNRRGSFVDVWVNGPDVLMLDQGGLTYGGDALGVSGLAYEVDAGPLDTAKASPGPRLSQVSIKLPDGRYVRLVGTLPVQRLTALMATLRRVDRPASG
jgi:hypothetical protein